MLVCLLQSEARQAEDPHWEHNGFGYTTAASNVGGSSEPNATTPTPAKISGRELRWLLDGLSLRQRQAHPEVIARTVIWWEDFAEKKVDSLQEIADRRE